MNDVERRLRDDARDMTAQIDRLKIRRDNLLREADAIRRARLTALADIARVGQEMGSPIWSSAGKGESDA